MSQTRTVFAFQKGIKDETACIASVGALNRAVDIFSMGQQRSQFQCSLKGFLKEDRDCTASVALLNRALTQYVITELGVRVDIWLVATHSNSH